MEDQSLLPHDDSYVLIHKRALAVNTSVLYMMSDYIAKDLMSTDATAQAVAGTFHIKAKKWVDSITDEELSQLVDKIIAQSHADNDGLIKVDF